MKTKLVIFDFADTIAKLSPSKEELLQNFINQEINLDVSIEKISEIYYYVTNIMFYSSVQIKDLDSKKEFYREFNKNVISLLGLSHLIDSTKLFDYFNEHGQHWILKNGVKELFRELKANEYLLSLVSNFDTRLYDILESMEILNSFDSIFISQEVGLEKPNIEFFKLALTRHDIKPENTFFIGDSYTLDYLPGSKLNLNTYLLNENGFYLPLSNSVSSFEEFKNILIKGNCYE